MFSAEFHKKVFTLVQGGFCFVWKTANNEGNVFAEWHGRTLKQDFLVIHIVLQGFIGSWERNKSMHKSKCIYRSSSSKNDSSVNSHSSHVTANMTLPPFHAKVKTGSVMAGESDSCDTRDAHTTVLTSDWANSWNLPDFITQEYCQDLIDLT